MPEIVTLSAQIKCAGALPPGITALVVTPANMVSSEYKPVATVMDYIPANIITFGMCNLIANPQVASLTSAALGVLTPAPCVPVITSPWSPGSSKLKIKGMKALTKSCKAQCTYGGSITIESAGQAKLKAP